jgi:hypothetical protein
VTGYIQSLDTDPGRAIEGVASHSPAVASNGLSVIRAALSCCASSLLWSLDRPASIADVSGLPCACGLRASLANTGVPGEEALLFPERHHAVLAVKVCARCTRLRPAAVCEP